MAGELKITLDSEESRICAKLQVDAARPGTVVRFKRNERSKAANRRLWALCTCFARQVVHVEGRGYIVAGAHVVGERFEPEHWKTYFAAAYARARWMPMENGGMVPLDLERTSQHDSEESSELMALIEETAARWGVDLSVRRKVPA